MSELGFEVDFNDLVYHGERSHIVDHSSGRDWRVTSRTIAELHAANGFPYAADDVAAAFADVTYSSAVPRRVIPRPPACNCHASADVIYVWCPH